MAYRVDKGLPALSAPKRMADGRMVFDAIITRTGVFSYFENGKERRELRLPEDVFDQESLDSYMLAPVTDDHPATLLDETNMRDHTVGAIGAVRRDGEFVRGPLSIFDGAVVRAMAAGKQQISAGYKLDIDNTSGVHPVYGPYDVRQRNIRVNHVAIVSMGRAGPEARVRMDSRGRVAAPTVHPAIQVANVLGAMKARRRSA